VKQSWRIPHCSRQKPTRRNSKNHSARQLPPYLANRHRRRSSKRAGTNPTRPIVTEIEDGDQKKESIMRVLTTQNSLQAAANKKTKVQYLVAKVSRTSFATLRSAIRFVSCFAASFGNYNVQLGTENMMGPLTPLRHRLGHPSISGIGTSYKDRRNCHGTGPWVMEN
jgi:hypothetical protein